MAEYIEREAAIRAVLIADCEDVSLNDVIKVTGEVAEAIKRIPAADVAPVRHGNWSEEILRDPRGSWRMHGFRCSVCGGFCVGESRYCPNCGAKMDADESEPTIIEADGEGEGCIS